MKNISAWMRSYFAFSQTESRGALVLILLIMAALVTMSLLSRQKPNTLPGTAEDWRTLDSLVAVLDNREAALQALARPEVSLFPFNPNVADSATLTQLGLKPWIAQRVVNYRQKGGKFRIKSDFKKIYGLPEATYRRLYPYLQLPDKKATQKKLAVAKSRGATSRTQPKRDQRKSLPTSFDINTADTSLLKQLPGIGTTLAARIIKYRQKLGGYHAKEQLHEIYHITETGAASLQKHTYIAEGNSVQRLNINQVEAKILAQHPYISWDLARAMVQHRQDYGEYRSLEDLREVYLMTEKVFEKIVPYLEI